MKCVAQSWPGTGSRAILTALLQALPGQVIPSELFAAYQGSGLAFHRVSSLTFTVYELSCQVCLLSSHLRL